MSSSSRNAPFVRSRYSGVSVEILNIARKSFLSIGEDIGTKITGKKGNGNVGEICIRERIKRWIPGKSSMVAWIT
jgi:hypothetical protein